MVNLTVRLKRREIPEEAYKVYTINDIFIYTNYKLSGNQQDTGMDDKKLTENYYIIDRKQSYNPKVFTDAMIFEKGDVYSLDDQNASLSRLVNIGNFKFVKNRFEPVTDSLLDVYYYLTPYPRKSLRFEAGALTQNDNRAGVKGNVSWRHRNTFKGAEELMLKVNGGGEVQYSGPVKQPNFYNLGAELSLAIPRFAVPLLNIYTNSRYLPHTTLNIKYNYESSAGLLRINSYSANYGYNWREGQHKELRGQPH
jgi:outer membrane protein assembly factor BamA